IFPHVGRDRRPAGSRGLHRDHVRRDLRDGARHRTLGTRAWWSGRLAMESGHAATLGNERKEVRWETREKARFGRAPKRLRRPFAREGRATRSKFLRLKASVYS